MSAVFCKPIENYAEIFNTLVKNTAQYITDNNLKCMILGISGGIDSTVVAAICHEVSKKTDIPLIGRSLPTKFNKEGEITTAGLVGKAFCTNYQKVSIEQTYKTLSNDLYGYECALDFNEPQPTALTNGNIQARLRMIYLYNLAGMYKGIVIDTDNLTENNLGYFTIHGDVGDFNPIGGLWKTEVFELAKYLHEHYSIESHFNETYRDQLKPNSDYSRCVAVSESLKLKPTAGLGITNSDLEELEAESYDQVDAILQEILAWKSMIKESSWNLKNFLDDQQFLNIPYKVVEAVATRHFASEFKRKQLPIKITRHEL